MRITMLVTSDLSHDPRVQKEAMSAHRFGHDVTVVCRCYDGPSLPYRVVPLHIRRQKRRWRKYVERMWMNVGLMRAAVRTRPQVVHANDLDTLPAAYAASLLTGAKLVYDAHELWVSASRDVGALGRWGTMQIERFLSRQADTVVAVSELRARRMVELLGIPKPTVVMNTPNYIASDMLVPKEWVREFTGKRIVLHQGRYVAGRGITEAVLASQYLPDDVILVFRGYGPIEADLRALVKGQGLSGKVAFLPPAPMHELVDYACGSALGLVLYTPVNENNLYAAPNKMFEYIMAGVPCVSSDIPYAREILLQHELGLVFTPGDSRDMARVILELLGDMGRLAAMREQCFRLASRFSWEVEVRKLLEAYECVSRKDY